MTELSKYLAYGLGSVALVGGSFVLFTALSGTPMSRVTGVGRLFPEDAEAPPADLPAPTGGEEVDADPRPAGVVVEAARSPLNAFLLPSPFSASELEDLEQRLQTRLDELATRERRLEERERQLAEDRRHYEELFAELEDMRTSILEMDDERRARAEELDRDRRAAEEREDQSYRDLAKFYGEGKARDMAAMLADVFQADEAALILSALSQDRAGELMSEVYKLDPKKGAALQEAYRAAQLPR